MSYTPTPLRYPGGKTSLGKMVTQIIEDADLDPVHYIDPFAGGGGLSLSLLFNDCVQEIHLNDLDRSIFCFWWAILNDTEKFINKIEKTKITIVEWHLQRYIQINKKRICGFDLGFSTFFLNRTNRSGIVSKASVIGGHDQTGNYKLDCRFNKKALIEKIRRIAAYKDRIHLYNLDALDFIKNCQTKIPKENSFYFIDPPYFDKGSGLYAHHYDPNDHANLAQSLLNLRTSWILTYDNVPQIQNLYKEKRQYTFDLNYSVSTKRVATELLIVNDNVFISDTIKLNQKTKNKPKELKTMSTYRSMFGKNDEWYTPANAIKPIIKYLKQKNYRSVWCPFDDHRSLFVSVLRDAGFKVINTHINTGDDFFLTDNPGCDCIVSNPPYSIKTEILEEVFSLRTPFALLMNSTDVLTGARKRFDIFKTNKFEMLFFDRRVHYIEDHNNGTPSNPPFTSVYICQDILPQQICFAEIEKQ